MTFASVDRSLVDMGTVHWVGILALVVLAQGESRAQSLQCKLLYEFAAIDLEMRFEASRTPPTLLNRSTVMNISNRLRTKMAIVCREHPECACSKAFDLAPGAKSHTGDPVDLLWLFLMNCGRNGDCYRRVPPEVTQDALPGATRILLAFCAEPGNQTEFSGLCGALRLWRPEK